jgi:hypothetical protein
MERRHNQGSMPRLWDIYAVLAGVKGFLKWWNRGMLYALDGSGELMVVIVVNSRDGWLAMN